MSGPEARPVPAASPAEAVPRGAVAIALDLLPSLRRDLLRLIGSMRAARCRTLMLVLAALARRPDARGFVLVVVATSRCYGRRGEPDDHTLPAHRSMSVVQGS